MDTKALRQKILDLAIHGKLVPQDPNDEPASVLLERIRAKKERLIKEGKIKKGKKSAKTSDKPHYPYELPKGWKWCKLGDIAYVGTGATPLTTCKYYYENGNIAWINSSSTKVPFIAKASNFITRKAIEETNCLVYPKGTLVIAMYGEGKTRGQISELLIDAATNQACAAVCPYFEATKEYLKLFFEGNYLHIRALAEGGNQPNLSLGKIQNYEIPLPPLDEQKRILEQAKKLLLQVENIEKEKEKNKNSIKQAKAKILNLAIHGKLVPHDLNDEPASELLRRINPKAEIISDNGHYQNLPKGWCLTTLESITNYGSCVNVSVQEIPKDAWVLELEDIEKDSAKILCARHKKDREIKGVRHRFKAGDILYSKLRTYLNKVLIAPNEGFCTTEIIPISVKLGIHNKYICHVLRSQAFLDYTAQCGYGVKMPRLSTKDAQNGIIPLPPYNEQLRIVSMVEKLLADLGTIEESLAR